jgi:hypothetical protein
MITVTFNHTEEGVDQLILEFNQAEAKGKIALQESAYGLDIILPEYCPYPVALVDLFYLSNAAKDGDRAQIPQIVIQDPMTTDDALAYVRFYEHAARIAFENGVRMVEVDKDYGDLYG